MFAAILLLMVISNSSSESAWVKTRPTAPAERSTPEEARLFEINRSSAGLTVPVCTFSAGTFTAEAAEKETFTAAGTDCVQNSPSWSPLFHAAVLPVIVVLDSGITSETGFESAIPARIVICCPSSAVGRHSSSRSQAIHAAATAVRNNIFFITD